MLTQARQIPSTNSSTDRHTFVFITVPVCEPKLYALDAEVKTSLFTRRENKTEVLSSLFSPVNLNVGLGMRLSMNGNLPITMEEILSSRLSCLPLAYDFRWSYKTDGMDLTRLVASNQEKIYIKP